MKSFIYKGFGMNGEGKISFKILATECIEKPVMVLIFSDDQEIKVDFGEKFNKPTVWIFGRSDIFCAGKESGYNWTEKDDRGEYDNYPRDWEKNDKTPLETWVFKTVAEAISWIKETVSERRDYWNKRRRNQKKLSLEILAIKPEDLVIEGVEEIITIYEKREKYS